MDRVRDRWSAAPWRAGPCFEAAAEAAVSAIHPPPDMEAKRQELVQEVMVQAAADGEALDRTRPSGRYLLWLKGIARNCVREELRERIRVRRTRPQTRSLGFVDEGALDPAMVRLGAVMHGDEVVMRVALRNPGSEAVGVRGVWGTCACARPTCTDTTIEAGGQSDIKVRVRATSPGRMRRDKVHVVLHTGQRLELAIELECVPRIRVTPSFVTIDSEGEEGHKEVEFRAVSYSGTADNDEPGGVVLVTDDCDLVEVGRTIQRPSGGKSGAQDARAAVETIRVRIPTELSGRPQRRIQLNFTYRDRASTATLILVRSRRSVHVEPSILVMRGTPWRGSLRVDVAEGVRMADAGPKVLVEDGDDLQTKSTLIGDRVWRVDVEAASPLHRLSELQVRVGPEDAPICVPMMWIAKDD